jgi:NAD(P)-dependent dehydrogenase (short-subunit alcohol dehydrogenase family)
MSRVANSTAIVTGGAVGLGASFARALAQAGATVTICDVDQRVERTAATLRASGLDVHGMVGDVGQPEDVKRIVDAAARRTGAVDVLVNNAAVVEVTSPTDEWTKALADYDRVMTTNLKGVFLFGRACAPLMAQNGWGEIINVSTDHVHTCGWPDPITHDDAPRCPWRDKPRQPGWVFLDLYDASKWALNGLTQSWAKMLRPNGVRVNNICMGATDSHMQRLFLGYGEEPGTEPPADLLDWWMKPEEVARVLIELIEEGISGRSGDNIGLWLGHPTVLPPASPILNVPPDFSLDDLADITKPPT